MIETAHLTNCGHSGHWGQQSEIPDESQQDEGQEEKTDVNVNLKLAVELVQAGGREQDVDGETAQLGEADEEVDSSLQHRGCSDTTSNTNTDKVSS